MGRKKKKDGVITTIYVSRDLYKKLEEKKPKKVSISDIVEKMLMISLNGKSQILEYSIEIEHLRAKVEDLKHENEQLKHERDTLSRKMEKLSQELEKCKKRWNSQKNLDKWMKKSQQIKDLVEWLEPHLQEGRTWGEVLEELGISDMSDRMDILHKLFYRPYMSSNDSMLVSKYLEWVLKKNDTEGYDNYVLVPVEHLGNYEHYLVSKFRNSEVKSYA